MKIKIEDGEEREIKRVRKENEWCGKWEREREREREEIKRGEEQKKKHIFYPSYRRSS